MEVGVGFTFFFLLQTNFFPDLMQVYCFPEAMAVAFSFGHLSPFLTAADEGRDESRERHRPRTRDGTRRLIAAD